MSTTPVFIDERINELIEEISLDVSGGPAYKTGITATEGGEEQRSQLWSQSHGDWSFGDKNLVKEETKNLQRFFHRVKGMVHSFRFKDWTDYEVLPGEGFARMTPYGLRLIKRYGDEVGAYERIITLPVNFTLKVNGDLRICTVEPVTGELVISGGGATEENVSWTGEFDVRVRLGVDKLPLIVIAIEDDEEDHLVQLSPVPIFECMPGRPPGLV